MYEDIKSLINNEEYQEAKELCQKELNDNSSSELYYLYFLSDNGNYIDFDYLNINNTYAYNKAIEGENKDYYSQELNVYSTLNKVEGFNKIFRYIESEKYELAFTLLRGIQDNKIDVRFDDDFYLNLNNLILRNKENSDKMNFFKLLLEFLYQKTEYKEILYFFHISSEEYNKTFIDVKNELDFLGRAYSFVRKQDEIILDDAEKIEIKLEDFKIENGVLLKYLGDDAIVVIPDNVLKIGETAFENCKELTYVKCSDSVLNIGTRAFDSCPKLETIEISNRISFIDNNAFVGCNKLKYTPFNDGYYLGNKKNPYICLVKYKGYGHSYTVHSKTRIILDAFTCCTGINKITILDEVLSIGSCAFMACYNLIQITIGKKVEKIEADAFLRCYKLKEIYNLSNTNLNFNWAVVHKDLNEPSSIIKGKDGFVTFISSQNGIELLGYAKNEVKLVVPQNISRIADYAFSYHTVSEIELPKELKSIGNHAFFRCICLSKINIPEGVKVIEKETFYETNLDSICIPQSVISIEAYAFYNCKMLTKISIASEKIEIKEEAFGACTSLKEIYINKKIKKEVKSALLSSNLKNVKIKALKN